jgi:hypothetical protein
MVWVIGFPLRLSYSIKIRYSMIKASRDSVAELGPDRPIKLLRIGNCKRSSVAFVSPDSLVIDPKVYARKFNPTNQTIGTMTNPAAGTKSIWLAADALVPCFLLAIWTISS